MNRTISENPFNPSLPSIPNNQEMQPFQINNWPINCAQEEIIRWSRSTTNKLAVVIVEFMHPLMS